MPTFWFLLLRRSCLQTPPYSGNSCLFSSLGLATISFSGVTITVDMVDRFLDIPGTIGVKWTSYDYFNMHRIKALRGGNVNVMNGPDETLLCGLSMGADGGIGGNSQRCRRDSSERGLSEFRNARPVAHGERCAAGEYGSR